MKTLLRSIAFSLLLVLTIQPVRAHEGDAHDAHGEHDAVTPEETTAKIEENLKHMAPEERKLVEAQRYCPMMPDVRLGEMGPPIKVVVDGQAIMVCCKGCQKAALANPAKTLKATAAIQERVATDEEIKASLSKLSAKDRELVAAQGFCPIMTDTALGAMGAPIKIVVNNQPVFLCCKGCSKKAQANPDKTLRTIAALKEKVSKSNEIESSIASLKPSDRGIARAQGYCAVMTDNPLGSMGTPVKLMVGDKPVFLCCAGCRRKALADPKQTLATVAELQRKVAADTAE